MSSDITTDDANGPSQLALARMHLAQAVLRSSAGLIFDTRQHLSDSSNALRRDRADLSDRLESIMDGDVTASGARAEMREVMQLIDADLEASI